MNLKKVMILFIWALFSQTILIAQQHKKFNKVIEHFESKGEHEKVQAALFLINNMPIHYSIKTEWLNSSDDNIIFDEFIYEDYITAKEHFIELRDSNKITPNVVQYKDVTQISSDFLIKNINDSFKDWKENSWSKKYSFENFCEYILPYKSLIEPLEENWRAEFKSYYGHFATSSNPSNDPVEICIKVLEQLSDFGFVTSRIGQQPLLSPSQMLFRREGNCPDLANMAILATRALGIATTLDFTPHFGASSNRHFWNTVINSEGKHIPFNATDEIPHTYNPNNKRMGKVLRKTFSIQTETLAYSSDTISIPSQFLKDKNYTDVTKEYVKTSDIEYTFNSTDSLTPVNYLSVYNQGKWKVIWWGKEKEGKTIFKTMGRDIIYLPTQYIDGLEGQKRFFEPYPLLLNQKGKTIILKPDLSKTYKKTLSQKNEFKENQQEFNSLKIKNNENYSLYYWDTKWVFLETSTAVNEEVKFEKVPKNALFKLLSEHPDNFERIFIIEDFSHKMLWY